MAKRCWTGGRSATENESEHVPAAVQSYLQTGGHGKLIINDALYPLAYGE